MINENLLARSILVLLVCSGTAIPEARSWGNPNASAIILPTSDGGSIELLHAESAKLHVICFLGTECPLARLYGPRLSRLADRYRSHGVRFVGVNANRQDSMDEVENYVQDLGISFPVAKDYDSRATQRLGATRTPEVFVVDADGKTLYQGRIDDQYQPGITKAAATRHELADALEALVGGRSVAIPKTEATGCIIGHQRTLAESGDVNYCDQVARVLQKHCAECHRAGEIGPFALTDYDEVVGWGEMMLEVVEQRRMPPWHADPAIGSFIGQRVMPEEDRKVLRDWVEGGMPYGDADQLPPELPARGEWSIGTPDQVLVMNAGGYQVPAEGTVEYQYFVVDCELSEDRWVSAAEVVPGARSVVHHAIAFIRPPDGSSQRGVSWLGAYVPGQRTAPYPQGLARRLPAGSKIVFQMHYTPSGSPQRDQTKIGLRFADPKDVTHEVYTLMAIDHEFEIPPRAADHAVDIRVGHLPSTGSLLGVAPHMHLRGKAFELRTGYDGDLQTQLRVPAYDFNWQHFYAFENPIDLSNVDSLEGTVWFDNSDANPFNPDPDEHVTWGDQTWEEMAIAFFEVAEPLSAQKSTRSKLRRREKAQQKQERARRRDEQIAQFVKKFFAQFDLDGDGKIQPEETTPGFRRHGFRSFDHNRDGSLTTDEISEEAALRM